MTVYSYSRISTYDNCPYQYKLQYIDGIKTEEESIEAFMGTRIHETLEKLYSNLILSKMSTLEELLAYYDEQWENNWHDKVFINNKDLTAQDYKLAGENAIKAYYSEYYPFNRTRPLWTERRVMIPLGDDDYKLQGVIDRLDKREDGVLEIHDYKGSKNLPTQRKLDEDKQLALYQLAVQEAYPEADGFELVWHYVLFNTELRSRRTQEQLNDLTQEYKNMIDVIENAKEFPTKESRLCDWCGYQIYCPAKKHLIQLEDFSEEDRDSNEGYILVDKYAELKQRGKEIDLELSAIKQKLIEYARINELEIIRGTDKRAKISIFSEKSLPSKSTDREAFIELEKIIRDSGIWPDFSKLDTKKLLNAFEGNELPKELGDKLLGFVKEEKKERIYLSELKEIDE